MNAPTPIPPETPIPVTLQAQQWNEVLAVLSDAPYRVVAEIIGQISTQAAQAAQAAAAQLPPRPNGAALDGHQPAWD